VPWHISKGHSGCPSAKPWAVIKNNDDSVAGCHASKKQAKAHLRALYANEKK